MGCVSIFILLCCFYWTAESCDFSYNLDYDNVGTGRSYTTGISTITSGSTYCYSEACIWCFTSWKYSINVLFTDLLSTTNDNGANCTKWRAIVEVGSNVVGTYCEQRNMKTIQTDSGILKVTLKREKYARIGHVFLMMRVETSTKGCGGSFSKLSEAVPITYSSLKSPKKLPTHCLWSFQIPDNFLLSISILKYEWLCTNSSSKYMNIRTWSNSNLWMMYCGHRPDFFFSQLKVKFLIITIHHEEKLLDTDMMNVLYAISTPGMAQYRSVDTFGKMSFKSGQSPSIPNFQGVAFLQNRVRYSRLYIVSDRQEMQCQGNNVTIYYESLKTINSRQIQCENGVFEFHKELPVESSAVIIFNSRNSSNRSTLNFSYFLTSMRCGGYHEIPPNEPLTISSLQNVDYFAYSGFHNCIWIVKSEANTKILINITRMTAQSPNSCSTTNVAIYHEYLKYSNSTKKDGFCSAPVGDITTVGDAMIVLSRGKHGYLSLGLTVGAPSHVYPTISTPRQTEPWKSKSRPPKKTQQTTKDSKSAQINPVVYVAISFGILSAILIGVLTTVIVRRRMKLGTSLDDANGADEEGRIVNRINSIDPLISIGGTLNRYKEDSKFGKRTKDNEMIEMYESEEDGKVNHGCTSISEQRPTGKSKRNLLYDSCQASGHFAVSSKKSCGNMKNGEGKERKQEQGQENNYEDVAKLKVETKQSKKDQEMLDVDVVYEEMTEKEEQNLEEAVYANADQNDAESYICPAFESEMQSVYSYVEPTVPPSIRK